MSSSSREEIVEVFDALDAVLDRLCGLTFDAITTYERLVLLERCERARRRLPVAEHPLINQLGRQATPKSRVARCHIGRRMDIGRTIRDDWLDAEVALLICDWFGVGPPAEDGLSAGRSPEVWGYFGRLRIVTIAPSPGVVKMP